MDEIDRAQESEEQFLADVLREHQRNRPTGASLEECEDCNEPIPLRRREA